MPRKSTTRAFREYAVSLISPEKPLEQVALELGIDSKRLKQWYKKSKPIAASACPNRQEKAQKCQPEIPELVTLATPTPATNTEKYANLEVENKYLKELLQLSANWISLQISLLKESEN